MLLIVLGLILISMTFAGVQNMQGMRNAVGIIRVAGVVLMFIGFIFSAVVQIGPGEVGVKKLFGKVESDVLTSGIHVVNPLVEVVRFDIKTQNYTMSSIQDEDEADGGDDAIHVLSSDGLELILDLTLLYKLTPGSAPTMLETVGADYIYKIVRPIARTKIRDYAANYLAVNLYSTKREEFQSVIFKSMDAEFKKRGIELEQILIRNIQLPQTVKSAIEAKINAEQEAQKMEFVLQKEKQEAERKRVEAQGIADYQRIVAIGLTEKQLQYERIKAQLELAKSSNSKVIVMGGGNTPIILDGR